jgi:4'-phosphopantetheinyl transferase
VVFWTELSPPDDRVFALLSAAERGRAATLRPGETRDRFVLGAALLRTAVASVTGHCAADLDIDRTCAWCQDPHGKPALHSALAGWHVSVSHAGALVGVAVTDVGPVGLDVERLDHRDYRRLLPIALAPDEPEPVSLREFLTYWTRKESVVKATGDGLVQPMAEVAVTGPAAPPRLVRYGSGEPIATMVDLQPDAEHLGALTVLAAGPIEVRQHRLRALSRDEAA